MKGIAKYHDWEKLAKRDINPVEMWREAMEELKRQRLQKIPRDDPDFFKKISNIVNEDGQRKCTSTLLAKNPNHFRDMAIKRNAKNKDTKEATLVDSFKRLQEITI